MRPVVMIGGSAALAVLVALLGGCEPCGFVDEQICTTNGCTCGDACESSSDCNGGICLSYAEESGGVCVTESWYEDHVSGDSSSPGASTTVTTTTGDPNIHCTSDNHCNLGEACVLYPDETTFCEKVCFASGQICDNGGCCLPLESGTLVCAQPQWCQ